MIQKQTYFQWDEKYNIGIKEIDMQHRRLVQMVNELYSAMYAGEGRDVLGDVLGGLLLYTKIHFQTEERFMKKHNFPEFISHQQIHEKMKTRVLELKKKFEEGKISNPVQISNFLKAWLIKHILKTDMKYAYFYKTKKKSEAGK